MVTIVSPVSPEKAATAESEVDSFIFGWREVQRTLANGQKRWERVPLSLEDILHPQVGDFRVHSDEHERFCIYLYDAFSRQLAHDSSAVVLHDVRVAWDRPDVEPHGPDIAVIFNVRRRRNWSTFDATKEGTKPTLIVEVTSPHTRVVDLVDKLDEYEQAGLPLYVVVDIGARKGRNGRRLIGYRLTAQGYVSIAPNESGRLWLEPVRLWLALEGPNLVCYDEAGKAIEGYTAVAAARSQAEKRAVEAEERAVLEAHKRAELEERLRQLEKELEEAKREKDG